MLDVAEVDEVIADAIQAGRLHGVVGAQGDILEARLDDAQVVVAFLPVGLLRQLLPSVLECLAPGARLVVHEQQLLSVAPPAPRRTPLLTAGGISVAHRWDRRRSSTG